MASLKGLLTNRNPSRDDRRESRDWLYPCLVSRELTTQTPP